MELPVNQSVKDQGVNSLLALLPPSKDLARSGGTALRFLPMLRSVRVARLFVNGCIQTNDRHLHRRAITDTTGGGLAGLLTIVDKCQYQTPVCGATLRFSKCWRQGGV